MFELKYMKCSKCGKKRIVTDSGICLSCKPNVILGIKVKENMVKKKGGTEVKSKSGNIDENKWMSRKE